MRKKWIVLLLAAVALMGALAATHGDSCNPLDGTHNALTSCPAAILPPPLVLGLVLVSLVLASNFDLPQQFVLVSIDRPPPSSPRPRDVPPLNCARLFVWALHKDPLPAGAVGERVRVRGRNTIGDLAPLTQSLSHRPSRGKGEIGVRVGAQEGMNDG
jgi:hypothetical protein